MKKSVSVIALSLALTSTAFAATDKKEQETRNEIIGASSGAVLGAILAGPVGGVALGVIGLLTADEVNDDNRMAEANQQLASVKGQLSEKDQQLAAIRDSYKREQEQTRIELVSLNKEMEVANQEVESNIQFRTASYDIEDHYKPQLNLLAKNLRTNPKMQVSLSGYADRRGNNDYNLNLSQERVNQVKGYLVDNGVKETQIITHAFGEASPVSDTNNLEGNFFDRRVRIKLADANKLMTAQSGDE
ncbi:sortase-associated OmpA-like protein PdsO [Neptunicella marina]|uniref:Sortase-associated OmpA-like protein PdsO n=1 Tax=Neptunicella marina TaxID=2125989 RepID=A0A8J6LY81_9ALTE|nr:sortase-associated OmpA-like protein PdsO [Neptunicella marina]MBC3766059.1 sortase-associated OmpA-like protein PdsO [Neptunicella marina]